MGHNHSKQSTTDKEKHVSFNSSPDIIPNNEVPEKKRSRSKHRRTPVEPSHAEDQKAPTEPAHSEVPKEVVIKKHSRSRHRRRPEDQTAPKEVAEPSHPEDQTVPKEVAEPSHSEDQTVPKEHVVKKRSKSTHRRTHEKRSQSDLPPYPGTINETSEQVVINEVIPENNSQTVTFNVNKLPDGHLAFTITI